MACYTGGLRPTEHAVGAEGAAPGVLSPPLGRGQGCSGPQSAHSAPLDSGSASAERREVDRAFSCRVGWFSEGMSLSLNNVSFSGSVRGQDRCPVYAWPRRAVSQVSLPEASFFFLIVEHIALMELSATRK